MIIGIIAVAIIILFAIKKNYQELLTFLAFSLILDWIFVNLFSTVPLIRTIAILIGKPILSVLTYAVIELICMGIFYYLLQKCNYIISILAYLIVNLIINKFYMTISGSIIIDLFFNLIIGIIIIIAYRKKIEMEDIKWFAIIGTIINAFLSFFIYHLWRIVGLDVIFSVYIFGILFSPYILGIILSTIIICLLRKTLKKEDERYKMLIYVTIIVVCGYVSVKGGNAFLSYVSAKPDKVYAKMNEINENQSLIGTSKTEVYELLGKPETEVNDEDENKYIYDAGKITNYLFFGERDFYDFIINFDENDKVKSTSIKQLD